METLAKKFVLSLALLTVVTSLSACTDEEVNTAVGVAAIGAGVAIVVAGGGHERRDYDRYDYDRRDYDHCGCDRDFRGDVGLSESVSASSAVVAEPSIKAADFAKTFNLSLVSSSLFLGALESAKSGHAGAIQKLGLTQQDIDGLKTFEMPSDSSVRAVAKNIKAGAGETRDMLSALLAKAKEQHASVQAAN